MSVRKRLVNKSKNEDIVQNFQKCIRGFEFKFDGTSNFFPVDVSFTVN